MEKFIEGICEYCGEPVVYTPYVISKLGRAIPLDITDDADTDCRTHVCLSEAAPINKRKKNPDDYKRFREVMAQ